MARRGTPREVIDALLCFAAAVVFGFLGQWTAMVVSGLGAWVRFAMAADWIEQRFNIPRD